MAQTNLRYLLIVLISFSISWPKIATIRYLFNISFCNVAIMSYAINYVAFCGDKHFGDLEHEAFYYGSFDTDRRIREADVLFIGDSHVQYAFSHPNVATFFSERNATFFLAGFGYGEGFRFVHGCSRGCRRGCFCESAVGTAQRRDYFARLTWLAHHRQRSSRQTERNQLVQCLRQRTGQDRTGLRGMVGLTLAGSVACWLTKKITPSRPR
jgi:hypothetical protein